jgi:hypothetical protein
MADFSCHSLRVFIFFCCVLAHVRVCARAGIGLKLSGATTERSLRHGNRSMVRVGSDLIMITYDELQGSTIRSC